MIKVDDHSVFREFPLWSGRVPAGREVDFVGQLTDVSFVHGWDTDERSVDRDVWANYPEANYENFEWIVMLEALLAAKGTFTMIELGAAYGRWIVAAACAARRRRPELAMKLAGVEADPTHCAWMQQHLANNGLDPVEHTLINAAIWDKAGTLSFMDCADPSAWYGQHVPLYGERNIPGVEGSHRRRVPAIGINDLLRRYDLIDFLDVDIQGAEKVVIPAGIEEITRRVKRVFLETHDSVVEELHGPMRKHFTDAGWSVQFDYQHGRTYETMFGPIEFIGGTLCLVNPALGDQPRPVGAQAS